MKPVCSTEAKWKYWRDDATCSYRHNNQGGFTKFAKRQMSRAKRRHANRQLREEA